jgi:hypothetical protein
MKLFIKYPTKYRPNKSVETLKQYVKLAHDMSNITILVSLDEDDNSVKDELYTSIHPNITVKRGPSEGKIAAINRDIPEASSFDILLLASDDMIPNVYGYDRVIRDSMTQFFPDTYGVLFFNDGYVGYKLNTLVICGSKYYQRFGYIYYPEYKSLYCDNEFMDTANRLGKQVYLNKVIIKHEHPANNINIKNDSLYTKNEQFYGIDGSLYLSRYKPEYDISVLICTIPKRHEDFVTLLQDIENYKKLVNIKIEVLFDSRLDISIGNKRQSLIDRANGLYSCFIDDDDKITPYYFQVIEDAIESGDYDCIQLNGRYYIDDNFDRPFIHSLKYKKWSEDENAYYRCPNHLNPIKTSIARKVKFHDVSNQEDIKFSEKLLKQELLKTEYTHDKVQYLYYFNNKGSTIVKPLILPKIPSVRWGIKRNHKYNV